MCGIAGYFSTQLKSDETCIRRMVETLRHRGPDDFGVWTNTIAGIALAHARLSVMDLSPLGHQPMVSSCGRYTISYNGEIYNFKSLQNEVEKQGARFRGHSDTEIMLECISRWGVEEATQRFNGMFAFALWDQKEYVLHLARDRIGQKPMYYGWMGKTFLFGSELKALRAHPNFTGLIDRNVLALYLRYNYVPVPYSIYRDIYKLPPGTILTIPEPEKRCLTPVPFWSAKEAVEAGRANLFDGTEDQAVTDLDTLLRDAVTLRMEADVPLGVLLSGGIDSSIIAALMQVQSARPVKTFTIGFNEPRYNEAVYAKAVAKHLGTEHTESYVTPAEAMDVIPSLPTLYDEPFADASQIPTFLVSQMARKQVTVCLSGDGGDESFGGYNRHLVGPDIWRKARWLPEPCRRGAARMLRLPSSDQWDRLAFLLAPLLKRFGTQGTLGDKFYKIADVLAMEDPDVLYRRLVSHWEHPDKVLLTGREAETILTDKQQWPNLQRFVDRMMFLDTVTYLPDDILVKVDRASMGVSLEVRAPLLDHRIVEFSWQIPLSMKIRRNSGKWLLRQVLYNYVPKELIDRPKAGFGVPIHEWLRGPLREWAESLLDEARLRQEGFFHPETIREKWDEHLLGRRNWFNYLWNILMFQAWLHNENRDVQHSSSHSPSKCVITKRSRSSECPHTAKL